MNWGWKVVVVYSAFVFMTLAMVFFFLRQKVDLVAEDYYRQEIEYQDQIDKISNANALKNPIHFAYAVEKRMVIFTFPVEDADGNIKGTILFYRPSNADEDKNFRVEPSANGEQKIAVGSMSKGLWRVKISWSANGKNYYDEKTVTL